MERPAFPVRAHDAQSGLGALDVMNQGINDIF